MGDYGTYCGTHHVYFRSQVAYAQLINYVDEDDFTGFLVGTLIPAAERVVNGYCNRSFGTPSLGTFVMDGSGKGVQFLPPYWTPMIGIGSGSIGGVAISASDLYIYKKYLKRQGSGFPSGKQNIVLYGSYGFTDYQGVGIVPPDVQEVTATLCSNWIADMVRRNIAPEIFRNLVSRQYQQNTEELTSLYVLPMNFSRDLKNMLDPYRVSWINIG